MGIRDDLKIPLSMLEKSFLDMSKYKGSYKGKRFLFEKSDDKLRVYVWKDYLSFENTSKDNMFIKEFSYSEDGIEKGIDFIEETNV